MYHLVIAENQKQNNQLSLSSEQKHYLQRVLRLKIGDQFIAMNGKGISWLVELTSQGGKIIEQQFVENELPLKVSLLVGLPKGNGFEEIVRCGTELGVSQFIPVITARTLLKPGANKLKRWRKIAVEAAEQSERLFLPTIYSPISFEQALQAISKPEAHCYLCVAREKTSHLGKYIEDIAQLSPQQIVIATGPEGGWTAQEIEMAIASNFQLVSLGKRILRAITAPIMAMSIIGGVFER